MTHAEIYQRVCEARPECAVPDLAWFNDEPPPAVEPWTPMWTFREQGPFPDVVALALITDHWTEMLPPEQFVYKCYEEGDKVWICRSLYKSANIRHHTRFHALAEFLVPGSTKEKP